MTQKYEELLIKYFDSIREEECKFKGDCGGVVCDDCMFNGLHNCLVGLRENDDTVIKMLDNWRDRELEEGDVIMEKNRITIVDKKEIIMAYISGEIEIKDDEYVVADLEARSGDLNDLLEYDIDRIKEMVQSEYCVLLHVDRS